MGSKPPDQRGGDAAFRSRAEAEAWRSGAGGRADAYGPATERMLALARVGPGSRVLALGAGTGDEVLLAARRVGPRRAVLATDIDSHGLAIAAGATRAMDAGGYDLPPWPIVYQQTQCWLAAGVFDDLVQDLRRILRLAEERVLELTSPSPS